MKTYLFDTFNRYKRFSEELDAQTILCNKAWWVFNDSGEKEVYIFNTDGTLIISVSGRVTNATWKYIAANKSLIITGNNQSYMVHPAFYDKTIFALQIDGTNNYAFLIDENNLPTTPMKSLSDLKRHFTEKERQEELIEQRKLQAELEILRQKELEAERKRQEIIEEQRQREIEEYKQKQKLAEEKKREAERKKEEELNDRVYEKYVYILFPLSVIEYILEKLSSIRSFISIPLIFTAASMIFGLYIGNSLMTGLGAILFACCIVFVIISKVASLLIDNFNLYDIAFYKLKKKYINNTIAKYL